MEPPDRATVRGPLRYQSKSPDDQDAGRVPARRRLRAQEPPSHSGSVYCPGRGGAAGRQSPPPRAGRGRIPRPQGGSLALVDGELEDGVAARELLVDHGEGVELVLHVLLILGVQQHLRRSGARLREVWRVEKRAGRF